MVSELERKLSRYEQDPIRFYDGDDDEELFYKTVGTIKAVRVG